MKTEYINFTDQLLKEFKENKNHPLINQISFAHPVCDQYSKLKHYCTMHEGKRYITSLEQKKEAETMRTENKKEAIKRNKNKLVFVAMGGDYTARYDNDICCHRIRTEITNPKGRKFFIEVATWGQELTHFCYVIDRDQEKHFENKVIEFREQIYNEGGFAKVSYKSDLYINYKKYQGQPYYWFKHEQWKDLKIKYTKENILNIVNELFECNFKEIEIDNVYLSPEDYRSTSPKN